MLKHYAADSTTESRRQRSTRRAPDVAAHAADREKSDPGFPACHDRPGEALWRRAGADLRARAVQLPRTRRPLEPVYALGARTRHSQRRRRLPDDAEPAR